jgi:hypothetical protein
MWVRVLYIASGFAKCSDCIRLYLYCPLCPHNNCNHASFETSHNHDYLGFAGNKEAGYLYVTKLMDSVSHEKLSLTFLLQI